MPNPGVVMVTAALPSVCAHYRCVRSDVAPVLYAVLGATFARWVCPDHAPEEVRL